MTVTKEVDLEKHFRMAQPATQSIKIRIPQNPYQEERGSKPRRSGTEDGEAKSHVD